MTRANRILRALACLGGAGIGLAPAFGGVAVGLAAVGAVGFGALLLLNIEGAFAVLTFASLFEGVPALELAVKAATVVFFVVWLATMGARSAHVRELLGRHTRLALTILLFVAWITASISWSERPEIDVILVSWYVAIAIFLMTVTLVTREAHLWWISAAIVLGGVLLTIGGLGGTHFAPGLPFVPDAVQEDRLQGGIADPNFFAALLVAGIVLAGGLMAAHRGVAVRLTLLAAVGILVLGTLATQSRGGLVALGAAAACALVVFRRRRLVVLGLVGLAIAVGAPALAVNPEALERVTTVDEGGTGRTDIWRVALAVAADHPILGVGIGNFAVHSPRYVDEVGPLERADLIAEDHLVAHSFYLELLAETGIVGLGLFLVAVGGGLMACWRAIVRLDDMGDASLAAMARAVFVAIVAILAAGAFLSGGQDERLWILLALGPAILGMAVRRGAPAPARPLDAYAGYSTTVERSRSLAGV